MLEGHPVLYPFRQKYVCEYNPLGIMSSGFMFDEIIVNIIRNKAL